MATLKNTYVLNNSNGAKANSEVVNVKTPLTEQKTLTFGRGRVLGDKQTQMRERERGIDRREQERA